MPSRERKIWIRLVTGLFILKILQDRPAYGQQIAAEIKRLTGNAVNPNPNFIYPLLRQMEENGQVTGRWTNPATRSKRIYTLTDAGRRYFDQLTETVQAKFTEIERYHKVIRSCLLTETPYETGGEPHE